MNKVSRTLASTITALMVAALACSLPSQKPDTSVVLTAIAGAEHATTATPTSTTSSTLTVTVSLATNCRGGPGPGYAVVWVLQPGEEAEVVGKNTPSNYWIVKMPTGETCWLWGQYALVKGDVSKLADVAPPAPPPTEVAQKPSKSPKSPKATATGPVVINPNPILENPGILNALAPSQPSNLTVTTDCTPPGREVKLSWGSVSSADGYYIYENGSKIFTTQGTYLDRVDPNLPTGSITYGVAAYNSYGISSMAKLTSNCP